MSTLTISEVKKSFKNTEVLKGINISIQHGTFLSLLGPSGCGKTTLLRCIAGLETISSGSIIIDGEDVTQHPPESRHLGMMFQNYALFPHMTVLENVRFGLRMQRLLTKSEQRARARAALEAVRMEHFSDRLPAELSGGQQQRVALARAIAPEPRILLLDEPLSNLDARLREDMQVELMELHRQLDLTTIFVTHDQQEAISMSDTIVLMRDGRIEQHGTPTAIYRHPDTTFVADFIGSANLLTATASSGTIRISGTDQEFTCPDVPDGVGVLVLRKEDVKLHRAEVGGQTKLRGNIHHGIFRGSDTLYLVDIGSVTMKVIASDSSFHEHEDVALSWAADTAVWIPHGSGHTTI